jgi:hypothetical protein
MIENLILIGIGFGLGVLSTIVVLYVGGRAMMSRKIDKMNRTLDQTAKILDDHPLPDPERLAAMLREVDDLADEFDEISPESS